MKIIVKKNRCTGCTACMNICPKHAITMDDDNRGFEYPTIDQSKCINCKLCKKICPLLNTKTNEVINKCYAGYSKEDDYKINSSSGGIFPLIANYILENNGIVIGAAFNNENKLEHIAITKKEDLIKLMGSKYLQSNLNNIFSYVKENINKGKILFVGTPCQVAGLKSYLGNNTDNLYCIDVVCHGVPSPKLFKKYVNELEKKYNDKLLNYIFRDKSTGWDTYSNTAIFKSNKFSELQSNNDYMKLFLSDVALRESCFNCNFKLGNKYSDITLGDFWGINNYYPEMYNEKGVSAIIINTRKGIEIFDCIEKKINYKECKIEEIINGNPSLKYSCVKPPKREQFFDDFDKLSINQLLKKYEKKERLSRKIIRKIKKIIKLVIKK